MEHVSGNHRVLKLDSRDNVLVALSPLRPTRRLLSMEGKSSFQQRSRQNTNLSRRTCRRRADHHVRRNRRKLTEAVPAGGVLTTRNLRHDTNGFSAERHHSEWSAPDVSKWQQRTFDGYRRADGQVGTRNYWLVLPLVFCENRNVELPREAFEEELGYARHNQYRQQVRELATLQSKGARDDAARGAFPNVCSRISTASSSSFIRAAAEAHAKTRGRFADCSRVYSSSQCRRSNRLESRLPKLRSIDSAGRNSSPRSAIQQACFDFRPAKTGSRLFAAGARNSQTFAGLAEANKLERTPAPLSALTIGLKCGGSDGFSGISANPALGHVSDMLVALGGKTILSEFPELCGVEQNLVDRSVSQPVAERFVHLMRTYAARAKAVHSGFEMNPSPGNIADGLITDAMKSAGAAKKGGTSPVTDVLDFPEY